MRFPPGLKNVRHSTILPVFVRVGIVKLSAGLVKVSGIVCETRATGKPSVRIQEWKNVATILMKCKQNIKPNEAMHRGTKLLLVLDVQNVMQPTKE